MIKLLMIFLLIVPTLWGQANWRCAFNPSLCDGPDTPPDRTELCDAKVSEGYVLVYGPPPAVPGCLSVPEKVEYFSVWKTWVEGSEALFEGESAETFKEWGFGTGLVFKRKWGALEREMIAFPQPAWGPQVPVVYAPGAKKYPHTYVASGQVQVIDKGACLATVIEQVPLSKKKKNRKNCD